MRLQIILSVILFFSAGYSQSEDIRDFKSFFDKFDHSGSFVLYDLRNDLYIRYNPEKCDQRFIPASTFKVFNSLAGLESKAVSGINDTIRWDGIDRGWSEWNKDMDMEHAFKKSCVWFYQEIARRVGTDIMQKFLTANQYGNQDISGGIDRFWLDGGLRISPNEQIEFLKELYLEKLEFSMETISLVKQIMIFEQNENFIIRAKTGWAMRNEIQIGWFIGYIERDNNVYFFATNIESESAEEGFTSRIAITKSILSELGLYSIPN